MTLKKVHKHPLLENDIQITEEDIVNEYSYSKAEFIITIASILLLIISVVCGWFLFGINDNTNPAVAFAVIPIGILYIAGALTSACLLWYSYAEQMKTKVIASISFLTYFGILIAAFIK
ncbi:hypothetical protein [Labilibacter marinus]|uniref:hypothetical protein n=1 Tax=Labilibacter marinus TaxID=1477105 RepID=UPI00094FDE50|nr:hypothetical protein [Labilibacter marinus]